MLDLARTVGAGQYGVGSKVDTSFVIVVFRAAPKRSRVYDGVLHVTPLPIMDAISFDLLVGRSFEACFHLSLHLKSIALMAQLARHIMSD